MCLIAEVSFSGVVECCIFALLILIGAGNGAYLAFLHRKNIAQLKEKDARIGNLMIPAKRRHALELDLVIKKQEILHLDEEINGLLIRETDAVKPNTVKA